MLQGFQLGHVDGVEIDEINEDRNCMFTKVCILIALKDLDIAVMVSLKFQVL